MSGEISLDQAISGSTPQPGNGEIPLDHAISGQPKEISLDQAISGPDRLVNNLASGYQSPVIQKMMTEEPDLSVKPHSLVGKAMSVAAIPLRMEAAATMKAAEVVGVPGAAEWNQKFNPNHSIIPNAYISDISDFYIDRAADKAGLPQIPGMVGNLLRGTLNTGKAGLGLGANYLLDPLTGLKVGQLTKEAETVQKMGGSVTNAAEIAAKGAEAPAPIINPEDLNTLGKERNLVGYRVPFTDIGGNIKGDAVQRQLLKLVNAPIVKQIGQTIRALSPDTGVPELDLAGRTHDNLSYGAT